GLQSWHVVDLKAGSVGRPREDALVFVLQHVVDGAHEARHGGEGRVDSIADVQIHFTLLWLVGREVGSEWLWLEILAHRSRSRQVVGSNGDSRMTRSSPSGNSPRTHMVLVFWQSTCFQMYMYQNIQITFEVYQMVLRGNMLLLCSLSQFAYFEGHESAYHGTWY
ncbi:hypothetical protein PC119_g12683, partial [Phytophthora cactorum]